ncbi:MAG TPA: DUF1614 domain-containing protein [Candidatus Saccharicenans sp.]|jgi:uncharacterized membrane protein|nr:DUF1614 domain-containing protein [Candidatus Saccharicenans sp.]HOT69266.1 DUF1614 domain-containing protein [Candidatus Saccharicenans sp.]HPC88413.1 DUF1614 domain-containing protein [Candidatus Saccharicenans sp.]HQE64676.1 DUF1614 domain-containing protein [Candidatus Saccharicenans sp.]HRV06449.1 DUF1614 domain-containing protein [Candidatus Saccharicenans sp.]
MFFLPVLLFFLIGYFILLGGLFFFLKLGVISFAFQRLGIPPDLVFTLLLLTLIGSGINIPIKKLHSGQVMEQQVVNFYGWKFQVPVAAATETTVLAINVGGAIIPSLISLYLIFRWGGLFWEFVIATAIVTFLVNRVARPVKGLGIATPALFPPLVAALMGFLVSLISPDGIQSAPVIAYVAGTLGTLIGADLMNLKKIPELGAPVASIGGAGTFDGVFLTGIIAVILTSI